LLVCLPRNEAVVKRLELPAVTDAELPQLVAFQAASRSSLPLSDLSLDFIPWRQREGVAGREVLAATVPNTTADSIRSIAQAIGVKPAGLTLSAVGWGEILVRRGVTDDQLTVVVHRLAERLEVSIFRGGVLLMCHAAHVHSAELAELHKGIVSDVSRAVMSIRSFEPTTAIAQLLVSGDDESRTELIATLGKRIGCPAAAMGPLPEILPSLPGGVRPAAIAAPLGHLLFKAAPMSVGLNLLAPRQPPKPVDTTRTRKIAIGIGAGVAAIVLGVGYWMWMSDLESTAESRRTILAQLSQSNTAGQPTVDSARLVESWLAEATPWEKSLDELTRLLPENKTLYLTKLSGETKATGDVKSYLKIEGFTKERGTAQSLAGAINSVATDRLLVPPPKARGSTRDDKYPYAFEAEVQWLRTKGDGKTAAKTAEESPPVDTSSKPKPRETP
jgi:Tfp pilus assembly PilM family ATPase